MPLLTFFWIFIKRQPWAFLVLTIAHLAWAFDQVFFPYILKRVTDVLLELSPTSPVIWQTLKWPLVMGASLWIFLEFMFRVYEFMSVKVFPKFEAQIRMHLLDYTQQHSYQFFSDNYAGNMANKISDVTHSMTWIMEVMITNFIPAFVAFGMATAIFWHYSPAFAIITSTWYLLHLGIIVIFSKRINALAKAHSEVKSELAGKLVDTFSNMIPVKLFSRHVSEYNYIRTTQYEERELHQELRKINAILRLFQGALCFLIIGVGMTWAMISAWQAGTLSATSAVYVYYASWNITLMAWASGFELPEFFKHMGICRQALQVLKAPHDMSDAPHAKQLVVTQGEIEFSHVQFGYDSEAPLFKDLSVTIKGGQKIGLVGASGSGKTTIANLLMRFFDVDAGEILIDGASISKVTQSSLRSQISMIPQEPSLFHRSVMDNIRFGKPDASDDEVIAASKAAHCHEFIQDLEEGYDTLVGERGSRLSGGQRQRVVIARAFLKQAPILVMDEATSALDWETEELIQESLNEIMKNRTAIVIAHRLSTLKIMDRILVFQNGEIVEDGAHEELIQQEGPYAALWEHQQEGILQE